MARAARSPPEGERARLSLVLFPTLTFAVFFVVVFGVSTLTRSRPVLWTVSMVAASWVFYGWWDVRFVSLLAGSASLNWWFGVRVAGSRAAGDEAARRWWVRAAVGANLGVLGLFKYHDFFVESLADRLGVTPGLVLGLVLPVGISFFTFQAISYVVDIGRGELEPAPLLDVALYLSFFPQLVAGPIVRAGDFLPILAARRRGDGPVDPPVGTAFRLIGAGLFKKVVISSYLADAAVDDVFAAPGVANLFDRLLAVYAYAIQIYADFSGYTDIAIGCALLLGFRFPTNFDAPYRAASFQDFWRRWHISLSTWLRDYLYIPLGGNRGGPFRTYRNLTLTMLLGGLWHGANWTFVVWGAIHGAALAAERLLVDRRRRTARPASAAMADTGLGLAVRWVVTFHVVCLAWVCFRAETLGDAWALLTSLEAAAAVPSISPWVAGVVAAALALQACPDDLADRGRTRVDTLSPATLAITGGVWVAVVVALAPAGVAPFIYFQF